MIGKLEITHLRTLEALFKFANLSNAAEHLDVSQQAVSAQLKKLRDILGDPLFVRTGHGVAPTPYAKQIEPHVSAMLKQLAAFPLPDGMAHDAIDRTLVISATDYAQTVLLAEMIKPLRDAAPNIRLITVNIEAAQLTKRMQIGEIDLALTTSGYVPDGLSTEALFTERYLCVTGNPELVPADTMSLVELTQHDFVVVSPGTPSFKGSADGWFEKQGLSRNVVASVPSFFVAQQYLCKSDLIGFIPSRLLPHDGLYAIALEKYPPGYEMVAAFHPGHQTDPMIRWLIDTIKARFVAP
ncbi:MAG: LysR family transcriptional regulator [Rhodospirillales bacterium]|nr:LysR family transcriptional regulator [Rhodospirillales bacterium]